jgi:hypothetical protein
METPKEPTTDEWIKKMWYFYTMEFYLAIKKDESILSEVSQVQKHKGHHVFSYMWKIDQNTTTSI